VHGVCIHGSPSICIGRDLLVLGEILYVKYNTRVFTVTDSYIIREPGKADITAGPTKREIFPLLLMNTLKGTLVTTILRASW
jgi:hypothetical protein